jgi:hypothetical protein
LNFGLISDESTVPLQIQVFDGSGRSLGEWSVGGQSTASVQAALDAMPAGSTLYFGITAANSNGSAVSSPTIGYQLWVDVQSAMDQATVAPGPATVPSSPIQLLGASPLTASTNSPVVASSGASQAAPNSALNQGGGVLPAAGLPAMRSARPLEGLLADGDPAPAVASEFNVVVNKEWDDRSLNGLSPRPADGSWPAQWTGREKEPGSLVVIYDSGGFPLLGAVAIGHRRRIPATTDLGDFASSTTVGGGECRDTVRLAAMNLPPGLEDTDTHGDLAMEPETLRTRPWSGFRVSIFSALGLATVFTVNAVLSQPLAGFDYLTARLDAQAGPPQKWKRRLRRATTATQE